MGKRGERWLADQLGALWEIEIENLDWNTMIVVVAVVVEIEEVDEGKHCVLQSKGRATINTDTHTHTH